MLSMLVVNWSVNGGILVSVISTGTRTIGSIACSHQRNHVIDWLLIVDGNGNQQLAQKLEPRMSPVFSPVSTLSFFS